MSREVKVYLPGDLLFSEGDPSGGLYFIQNGKVEIFKVRDNNEVLLGTLGSGEVLGTLTVFNGDARTASARALTQVEAQYMSSASLSQGMSKIPVWAVAIIKDTIARLKHVDELLIQTTLNERRLRAEAGTVLHHASQLARVCSLLFLIDPKKVGSYEHWGIKGIAAKAEGPLNLPPGYIEPLLQIFAASGLLETADDKKQGKVFVAPESNILSEFADFAVATIKKGTTDFIPSKHAKLIGNMIRIRSRNPDKSTFTRQEFLDLIGKEGGRKYDTAILTALTEHLVITESESGVSYDGKWLTKRIVFETVCRALLEADLKAPSQMREKAKNARGNVSAAS
jgi:hypothetical protein